ncbi:hypothetical protein OG405_15030 [Nocardia sp. NBC_01329]|nr:hypothetical protein OG405_15030 [Nocardia sp. NBC_01329]
MHDDPLPDRFAAAGQREIGAGRGDPVFAEDRPGELAEALRQQDQRLSGVAECGGAVIGEVERSFLALVDTAVARWQLEHTHDPCS